MGIPSTIGSMFIQMAVQMLATVYRMGRQKTPLLVAKYTCIAMTADGVVTSIIMLVSAGLCFGKVR